MRSQFHARWMAVALLSTVCLLALTHIPNDALPKVLQRDLLDKIEHAVAYGVIAILFLRALRRPVRPLLLLIVLASLAVVGALDEVTQPMVNRYASVTDYAFDLIGIAAACVIFLVRRGPNGNARIKMRDAE